MKHLRLALPEDVYAALRKKATALKRPATVIAREAVEAWLRERRRASIRESIAAYAARHAGSTTDLDRDLEATSLEPWRPRRRR